MKDGFKIHTGESHCRQPHRNQSHPGSASRVQAPVVLVHAISMRKIQGYETQEKQTTTSKMKKLCTNKQTNKQTLHNLQMAGILLLLETSKPPS